MREKGGAAFSHINLSFDQIEEKGGDFPCKCPLWAKTGRFGWTRWAMLKIKRESEEKGGGFFHINLSFYHINDTGILRICH